MNYNYGKDIAYEKETDNIEVDSDVKTNLKNL